ncbi:hypothetical protein [Coxiella burnetii]|nr:hypothetical protein [Coxiella burnetii]
MSCLESDTPGSYLFDGLNPTQLKSLVGMWGKTEGDSFLYLLAKMARFTALRFFKFANSTRDLLTKLESMFEQGDPEFKEMLRRHLKGYNLEDYVGQPWIWFCVGPEETTRISKLLSTPNEIFEPLPRIYSFIAYETQSEAGLERLCTDEEMRDLLWHSSTNNGLFSQVDRIPEQPSVERMRKYLLSKIKLGPVEIARWMTICKSEKDLEWVAFIFQKDKKEVQKKIKDSLIKRDEQRGFLPVSYLFTTSEGKDLLFNPKKRWRWIDNDAETANTVLDALLQKPNGFAYSLSYLEAEDIDFLIQHYNTGENILLRLLKTKEGREVLLGSSVDTLGKIKLPEGTQQMIFDYFMQIDPDTSLPRFIKILENEFPNDKHFASIVENEFPNAQEQAFSRIIRPKCYDWLKEKIIKDDDSIDWKELSVLFKCSQRGRGMSFIHYACANADSRKILFSQTGLLTLLLPQIAKANNEAKAGEKKLLKVVIDGFFAPFTNRRRANSPFHTWCEECAVTNKPVQEEMPLVWDLIPSNKWESVFLEGDKDKHSSLYWLCRNESARALLLTEDYYKSFKEIVKIFLKKGRHRFGDLLSEHYLKPTLLIEHHLKHVRGEGYIIYWLMKNDAGIKLFFDRQEGLLYSFENEDIPGWSAAFFSLLLPAPTAESILDSLWLRGHAPLISPWLDGLSDKSLLICNNYAFCFLLIKNKSAVTKEIIQRWSSRWREPAQKDNYHQFLKSLMLVSYSNHRVANFLKENPDNRSFLFAKDSFVNDIFERFSFEEAEIFFEWLSKEKGLLEVLDKDESTQWVSSALEGKIKNAQELPHSISEPSSRSRFFQPTPLSSSEEKLSSSEENPPKKAKTNPSGSG